MPTDRSRRRTRRAAGMLALILALAVAPVSGQDLRVDVRLVNIVATVTDAAGRYVAGLTAEDFIVEDGGAPQAIAHFSYDRETPVSVGFALDTSASMDGRIRTALAALDRFMGLLHEDDDIFVATFNDQVELIGDFTRDRARLARALNTVQVSGGTALYDAAAMGLEKVREGRPEKRALILLTDGADTSSRINLPTVLDRIGRAEVLVYGLGVSPERFGERSLHVPFEWPLTSIPGAGRVPLSRSADDPVAIGVLRRFADASGGRAYLIEGTWTEGRGHGLDAVLDEISAELRSQYTIGFYPSAPADGRLRPLTVRVRGHEDYTVRARSGYHW